MVLIECHFGSYVWRHYVDFKKGTREQNVTFTVGIKWGIYFPIFTPCREVVSSASRYGVIFRGRYISFISVAKGKSSWLRPKIHSVNCNASECLCILWLTNGEYGTESAVDSNAKCSFWYLERVLPCRLSNLINWNTEIMCKKLNIVWEVLNSGFEKSQDN